jgi:hypothetical protein
MQDCTCGQRASRRSFDVMQHRDASKGPLDAVLINACDLARSSGLSSQVTHVYTCAELCRAVTVPNLLTLLCVRHCAVKRSHSGIAWQQLYPCTFTRTNARDSHALRAIISTLSALFHTRVCTDSEARFAVTSSLCNTRVQGAKAHPMQIAGVPCATVQNRTIPAVQLIASQKLYKR